ncbi:MAG: hypothetical protein ISN28_15605 [Ectothiorhodospiraceae bacterium AqS1]|nr:hypothetical protein [Ectothiorhodospiraceae bacterium AqS1]MBF2761658.1 hypothetical protein [Ectothiorhodospiraceae bacterium AqS1]
MDNEKNGMNMNTEQARQFFTVAVEQAVTKAIEQAVNPRFDEINLKMEKQNREQNDKMEEQSHKMEEQSHKMEEYGIKMENLRTDMRIAISESNAARLKGVIAISGLITGLGSAIAIGVSSLMVMLLK